MKKLLIFPLILLLVSVQCRIAVFAQGQYGNVYCRNSSHKGKIALTFDDGPHPRYTEKILHILEEYGITATFFVIGVNAENYPDALQLILDSGCEIGNHTYSHAHINQLEPDQIKQQILKCQDILYEKTGIRPCVFRPPEGVVPKCLNGIMEETDYNVVLWSIDTLDWAMNPSENISKTVLKNLQGGDIILMHDYVSGGNTTCDALRIMIPQILAKGYEFVTVSELINGS